MQPLRSFRRILLILAVASASSNLTACASDTPDASTDSLEIEGEWTSDFGAETISSSSWNTATVVSFDNADNAAVTQNAPDDEFNPSLFNKVVWTDVDDDAFYYCIVAFGLETSEAAESSTETADASDPESTGCGGTFPWTKLTRAEP